eukprot:749579-Hanusia_phi.AAC.3
METKSFRPVRSFGVCETLSACPDRQYMSFGMPVAGSQLITNLPRKVRLLPRRKRKSSVEGPKELVLGMDQISLFFHLPQCEAATQMGISLSALKTVCRKVGLEKWPYKRKYFSAKGLETSCHNDLSLFEEALEHVQGSLVNSSDF